VSEGKIDIWFWAFWVGLILIAYGFVTFATAIWSPEAAETAGQLGIYGSLTVGIIGIIVTILGYVKRR